MVRKSSIFILAVAILAGIVIVLPFVQADSVFSTAQNTSEWRGYALNISNNRHYTGLVISNITAKGTTNYTMPGTITAGPVVANGYLYIGISTKLYQMNYSNYTQTINNYTSAGTISTTLLLQMMLYILQEAVCFIR